MVRSALVRLCCAMLACSTGWAQTPEEQPRYQLVVIRGEDAQNNIKKGRATKAVVEVRDRNNNPVAGVAVLFLLPDSGAGGSFVGGTQTASVSTNSIGQASVTYTPNNVTGDFNLKASVKNGTNETNISIRQRNTATAVAAGLSTTAIVLLALAGAGLGVGLGVGLNQGGGSTRANTVTLTPGSPSVGPPK